MNMDKKMELIENHPCHSKQELLKREGFHIQNAECVNRCFVVLVKHTLCF